MYLPEHTWYIIIIQWKVENMDESFVFTWKFQKLLGCSHIQPDMKHTLPWDSSPLFYCYIQILGSFLSILVILVSNSPWRNFEHRQRSRDRLLQPPDRRTSCRRDPTDGDTLPLGSTTSLGRRRWLVEPVHRFTVQRLCGFMFWKIRRQGKYYKYYLSRIIWWL